MKWNFVGLVALAALVTSPSVSFAQAQAPRQMGGRQRPAAANDTFDPHDLSGVWDPLNLTRNWKAVPVYGAISADVPPMTPWAKAQYDAAKPSYGPRGNPNGNDPIFECEPTGIPRIFFFPQPFQFIVTPGLTIQVFEREHTYRYIYTDGREHPKDVGPSWMGHAIGKWDGDTFVVDSVGFNDKAWLDFWGNPRSEKMHLIEKWKRVDPEHISVQLIDEDPGAYTQTWVGDTKVMKINHDAMPMEELPCIYREEHAFGEKIRERAVHGQGDPSKPDQR
jgi:hypothetical protein